jgi:hypothetical protein
MSWERSPAPTARPPAACSEKRCHSSAARSGFRATCREPRCGARVDLRREDGQLRLPQLRAARPSEVAAAHAYSQLHESDDRTIGTGLEDTCSATTSSPRSPVPPTRTTFSSWPGIPAVCSTTRRTRGPFRSQAVGGGRAGDGMLLKTPSSSAAARTGPPPPGPSSATRQAMPSSTQERTPVGPSSSGRSERGRSDSDPRSGHSLDHSSRSLPLSRPMSRSGRSDMVPPALRRRPKLAREKWPSLMGDHGDHRP